MSISRNQRAGLVVLGVTAVVVVGVVVAGAVSWNGSDLRSRPRSGPTWCQEQASNRPIINLVNEAAIGGNAWQSDRAMLFGGDLFGPSRVTGIDEDDLESVKKSLQSAATGTGTDHRIDPAYVPEVRAAALRLDQYCNTHP